MYRFDTLGEILPKLPDAFDLKHLKRRQHKCRRLIYRTPPRGTKEQETDLMTSHMFILSYDKLAVFAMEAFVYVSDEGGSKITTVFVSKADTTGHYYNDTRLSIASVTTEIIRQLLRLYVDNAYPVRVCLFAKAEKQYLFPLSYDSGRKHVLWDSALVKWWCKVLEPLRAEFSQINKARLQIPGSDTKEIEQCFPKQGGLPWQVGDVFWHEKEGGRKSNTIAVKCIPRFPDDPKGRFLDFLVSENRATKVKRDQFWLELQARQEFRLGSVVGILGIEGTLKDGVFKTDDHSINSKSFKTVKNILTESDFSTTESARDAYDFLDRNTPASAKLKIFGKHVPQAKTVQQETPPTVNVLNASFVRKKKK